jgi:hypothetical protein
MCMRTRVHTSSVSRRAALFVHDPQILLKSMMPLLHSKHVQKLLSPDFQEHVLFTKKPSPPLEDACSVKVEGLASPQAMRTLQAKFF